MYALFYCRWTLAAECHRNGASLPSRTYATNGSQFAGGARVDGASVETDVDDAGNVQQLLTLPVTRAHNGRALTCEAINAYGSSTACISLNVQCTEFLFILQVIIYIWIDLI